MAFGAVFTTSDPGGGRHYTRFLGPLLVGNPADNASSSMGAFDGSAARPLYSFYNRPDMGWYPNATSSAGGKMRASVAETDVVQISSAGAIVYSSGAISAGGYYSTAATAANLYIPATTGALSTAATPMLASTYGVPIAFDTVGKQLWIYSSNTGWVGIGPTSSGGNLWVTSSAA